jgi:hypothetical protein
MYTRVSNSTTEKLNKRRKEKHSDDHLACPGKQRKNSCNTLMEIKISSENEAILERRMSWQSNNIMGTLANVTSVNRLIMLHVEGINDFVPNAQLLYMAECATGDYHGQKNRANSWLT